LRKYRWFMQAAAGDVPGTKAAGPNIVDFFSSFFLKPSQSKD
jgi:hypothetical protein